MTTGAASLATLDGYQSSVGITTGLTVGHILGIILATEIILSTALFRAITQQVPVIPYRRFWTTYQSSTFLGQ